MIIMSLLVFEKQSPNKQGDCFALVSIQPRRTLGLLDQRARNDRWAKVNALREKTPTAFGTSPKSASKILFVNKYLNFGFGETRGGLHSPEGFCQLSAGFSPAKELRRRRTSTSSLAKHPERASEAGGRGPAQRVGCRPLKGRLRDLCRIGRLRVNYEEPNPRPLPKWEGVPADKGQRAWGISGYRACAKYIDNGYGKCHNMSCLTIEIRWYVSFETARGEIHFRDMDRRISKWYPIHQPTMIERHTRRVRKHWFIGRKTLSCQI